MTTKIIKIIKLIRQLIDYVTGVARQCALIMISFGSAGILIAQNFIFQLNPETAAIRYMLPSYAPSDYEFDFSVDALKPNPLYESDSVHMLLLPSYIVFVVGIFLFITGWLGIFFHNRTFMMVLVKAEMMFLGVNVLYIALGMYFVEISAFVYSLILFGIMAAESVLGICLFFVLLLTNKEEVLYDISDQLDEWR